MLQKINSFAKINLISLSRCYFASCWNQIKEGPRDPIFDLAEDFKLDTNKKKLDLTVGAYRDKNGKPYILNCVKEASRLFVQNKVNHEYLPCNGSPEFVEKDLELLYKNTLPYIKKAVTGVQTISGTGALRTGMVFLKEFFPGQKTIYIPRETWPNHFGIAEKTPLDIKKYRYYDYKNKNINFNGLIEDIEKAENSSIILIHACAHNPTGMDLNKDQWYDLLEVIKKKDHMPFLDLAYQGFVTGDLCQDAYPVRLFANSGINFLLAHSYAKNFGLYGERVGCLSVVCQNSSEAEKINTQLKYICRTEFSSCPKFGSYVVKTILGSRILTKDWEEDVKRMAKRIRLMREKLVVKLKERGNTCDWGHIIRQGGFFAFSGLTKKKIRNLRKDYHIYIPDSGRINMAALTDNNLDYFADALHKVTNTPMQMNHYRFESVWESIRSSSLIL